MARQISDQRSAVYMCRAVFLRKSLLYLSPFGVEPLDPGLQIAVTLGKSVQPWKISRDGGHGHFERELRRLVFEPRDERFDLFGAGLQTRALIFGEGVALPRRSLCF